MRTFATSVNDVNVFNIYQNSLGLNYKTVEKRLMKEFDRVHETFATRDGIEVFSPAERNAWDLLVKFLLDAKEAKAKADPRSGECTLPDNTGHVSVCLNTGAVLLVLISEARNYGDEIHAGDGNSY